MFLLVPSSVTELVETFHISLWRVTSNGGLGLGPTPLLLRPCLQLYATGTFFDPYAVIASRRYRFLVFIIKLLGFLQTNVTDNNILSVSYCSTWFYHSFVLDKVTPCIHCLCVRVFHVVFRA